MISFRPIQHHEFADFADYFVADYATEITLNYRLSEADALAQAQEEIASSFPDREKTVGQVLLCITLENADETQHIGYLWYKPDHELKSAYINDFYLFPNFRGKGFGSQAMKRLEEQLEDDGFTQLKLRVAADNQQARHVYEANGFAVTGINMNKLLGKRT